LKFASRRYCSAIWSSTLRSNWLLVARARDTFLSVATVFSGTCHGYSL